MKFKGTKEELSAKIQEIGYQVEIKEAGTSTQFRTLDGAVVY